MNSKDSYLNLRLTSYISLLNNLRDNVLSGKNNVTWLSDINIIIIIIIIIIISFSFRSYFTNLLQYCKLNYSHANKGYCCCCCWLRSGCDITALCGNVTQMCLHPMIRNC